MLTYTETLDFLFQHEVERMDLGLERVEEALRLCGSPHTRVPIVHIAGTNGKGSTAAVVHAVLSAAGYRVGLFTSPHLVDFCERIRLGLNWISEQEVIDGVAQIRAQVEPVHIPLTPFEMMSLLAFHAFTQADLDIAVVEVGLGGRLDATNVVSSLVSTITQMIKSHINFSHLHQRQDAFLHAGASRGGEKNDRQVFCHSMFNNPGQLLAHNRAHTAAGKGKIKQP